MEPVYHPGKRVKTWAERMAEKEVQDAELRAQARRGKEVHAHQERERIRQQARFPASNLELDLNLLTIVLQNSHTPFAVGAIARLKGQRKEHMPIATDAEARQRHEEGWDWADRMVEARTMLAYIEEESP